MSARCICIVAALVALAPLTGQGAGKRDGVIHAEYACADGTTLQAGFAQDPPRVNLRHGDKSWRLPIAKSGSGARYSNGRVTFWEHQGEATLEGKRVSLKCKVERPTSQ